MIAPWRSGFKRVFDGLLAAAGLVFFSLPMAWIAWRVRRELNTPVFFRQPRVGRAGKPFILSKFKTLSDGKPVTPFGHWLRATAMDELPQLINIVRGEMSFVGPRPLIPDDLRGLAQIPGGSQRQSVRPGLTGLAQLYADKTPSLPERLQWDLAYARECSFLLDLKILLASVIISLRGAWEKTRAPTTRGKS